MLIRELVGTNQVQQRSAGHRRRRSEDRHLFAVASVGTAILNLTLGNTEVFSQCALQAGAVEGGESRNLRRFQAGIQEGNQAGDIGRVEDDDDMLYVRTIFADVPAEVLGNLRVALQQVFASHASLAGSAAGRDNVFGARQGFLDIRGISNVGVIETTVEHFLSDAFQTLSVRVVEAHFGTQTHHERGLRHVGTNHTCCADDSQLFIC